MEPLQLDLEQLGLQPTTEFMQSTMQAVTQIVMEHEVSALIDAQPYERNDSRHTYRNGYRSRRWKTVYGDIRLRIPKLRRGTYTPDFITSDYTQRLIHVLQRAWIQQVYWDDVEDFLTEIGMEASPQLAAEFMDCLDEHISLHRRSPIKMLFPFLWLNVLPTDDYRQQIVMATGIQEDGTHQLLDFEIQTSIDDEFWITFLRGLVRRGLDNVQLVISDAYKGVKVAIYEELIGAEWQFSRDHFIQHVLANAPEEQHAELVDAISTVFIQADQVVGSVHLTTLGNSYPDLRNMLQTYASNLLTYTRFQEFSWSFFSNRETVIRIKQDINEHQDAVGLELPTYELTRFVTHELRR